MDNEFSPDDFELPAVATMHRESNDPRVDAFGNIVDNNHVTVEAHDAHVGSIVQTFQTLVRTAFATAVATLATYPQHLSRNFPDLDALRPNFGWVPTERIQKTLKATTQFYRATVHHPFRKHFKSRFPPPMSAASQNGLPLIPSSPRSQPLMMAFLAMVVARCSNSTEVCSLTSLLATPCPLSPTCLIPCKTLSANTAPWKD